MPPAGVDPPPAVPAGRGARFGPRVLAWSLALGVAYGLVAGAATNVQFSFGLSPFGGLEYVPRVIVLSAVRGWGPWGAALVPAVTAIVVLHRAGRRGASAAAIDRRLPLFVGAATLLLYPIVVTTGCFGALVVWKVAFGGAADVFVASSGLRAADVAHGTIACAIDALALALGVRLAGAAALSGRWPLALKLLVAWASLQGLAYAMGYLGRGWLE